MIIVGLYCALALLLIAAYLLQWAKTLGHGVQEPPLLQPKTPLIGHIIGLMRHEASYFSILRTRTSRSIVTLPLLNQKTYFIFSPYLIQQAMRHRNLDFDLVGLTFAKDVAAITEQAMVERVKKGPNTYTTDTITAIKTSLTGQGLHQMNTAMLKYMASELNCKQLDGGLRVSSLWIWMRDMMSMATVEAMYGSANPFREDLTSIHALWDFDDALPAMLFMPPALARAGARHRDRVVETLRPYFDARMDRNVDVSTNVAMRTEASIKYNVGGDDLCKGEVINIWVSIANSIPGLFWTFVNIWLAPGLAARVREEISPFVAISDGPRGKRKATLDIREIEKSCPLITSCQQEGIRFSNHNVARRAIMADATLIDEDGTEYVLKQGTPVMWSAKVAHELHDVWGPDALQFNPERFLGEVDKETEKKRRAAYFPFGGGLHLCPGRNFANTEILALVSCLILGFDIVGLQRENLKMGTRQLANAIPKPALGSDGGLVTIKRKVGWENVHWHFEC